MNRALLRKTIGDAWLSLSWCMLLLFAFAWLFVWMTSLMDMGAMGDFLGKLLWMFENVAGLPLNELTTSKGKIALLYIDALPIAVCVGWVISRGSDAVSGEVGRGTMEILLAQPISRKSLLVTHALVTICGCAVLPVTLWLGVGVGLALVDLRDEPQWMLYLPSTLNLFALNVAVAGIVTMLSACQSERWKTIGCATGFYIVEVIIKIVSRTWPAGDWLQYFSFQSAYEPQLMAVRADQAWSLSVSHNSILLGLGLVCYLAALVVFEKRDLPAPI